MQFIICLRKFKRYRKIGFFVLFLYGIWQSCSSKLSSKIEELESRLDDLNANKKKRMDKEVRRYRTNSSMEFKHSSRLIFCWPKKKIEATKNSLETHQYYLETLERIGKMVRKNQFSVKKVFRMFMFRKVADYERIFFSRVPLL